VKKKRGRPLATDQPRNKYVVMRVSEKEKNAIMQCFRTAKDLRDYIMKVVWEKTASNENKPRN
jgi:hypothetical protein